MATDGKTIAPTGKALKLTMSTIGQWKNGVKIEEYLFLGRLETTRERTRAGNG